MKENHITEYVTSVFLIEMTDFMKPLKWFAVLGIILIFADLKFGISAAIRRGEKIRFSRAGRRTLNKMADYSCWLLLSAGINKAISAPFFDMPLLPALILLVIYGFEINSCFSNYFESIGKKYSVDIFSFLRKKIEIIEINQNQEVEQNKNQKDDQSN